MKINHLVLLASILLVISVLSTAGTGDSKRPKKTSIKVRVTQLEQRVEELEKDNNMLIMAKLQHEQDIRQLQSRLSVTPHRRR